MAKKSKSTKGTKRHEKLYRKKLTNSGGGICTAAGFAAVIACCGAAGEFLAALLYDRFYTQRVYPRYTSLVKLVENYGCAAVTAVFAVIMFIWAVSAARGKRLGREFGLMGIFMGAALCLSPGVGLYSLLTSDFIEVYFKTAYDSDKFQGAVELARYGAPIISALILLFAGIGAMARISGEDFVVEAPRGRKRPKSDKETSPDPEGGEFADPRTFGSGRVDRGLTGETKPATYGEAEEAPLMEEQPVAEEKTLTEDTPAKAEGPAERPQKKSAISLCPKCGELVGKDELFCSNCGYRM